MAFIDVRMPPGIDGVETTARIWQLDPDIQIVICTPYCDHTWEQILQRLGRSDRLVVLKKPFDNIEVLQLADTLTQRWQGASVMQRHLQMLQQVIADRTNELRSATQRLAAASNSSTPHCPPRRACAATWQASCARDCVPARSRFTTSEVGMKRHSERAVLLKAVSEPQ